MSLARELRACLRLALPLAGSQLSEAAINFVDTMMMGWLGEETLAAGALGATTFLSLTIMATGFLSAVGALGAIALGQHQQRRVQALSTQSLWLVWVISLPLLALLLNSAPILRNLGQPEAILRPTQTYLSAIAWGLPAALGFVAIKNIVTALERPRLVLWIMLGGIGVNALGNYVLMFGHWGFPALGILGLGLASTLAFWLKFLVAWAWVRWQPQWRSRQLFRWGAIQWALWREIARLGVPTGLLFAIETGLFACVTYLMGTLGTTALAAHQIALQSAAATFMVPLGIAYATTARVGQFWGRGERDKSRLAGGAGLLLGSCFMAGMGILFWWRPLWIIGIYLDLEHTHQAVVEQAIALLKIAGLFQIFDGAQAIANGALRGVQDTRIPLGIGLLSYWLVGLGSGYVFGLLGQQDALGLWRGLLCGLMVAAIALMGRFWWQTRD